MSKYLNEAGLAYYDGKQKERLAQKANLSALPKKLSDLTNDTGFITGEEIPAWAKAETKPAYTATEVGAIPAADADTFAKKSDLTSVYKYKGSVATVAELPASGNTEGDVWNVEATDMNYGWTGTAWDPLGQMFSVDSITNAEIDTILSA